MLVTASLGAILYPTFKLTVAGPVLSRTAPWTLTLFDFKEALALTGVPIGIALIRLGRREVGDRPVGRVFALFSFALWAIVAFCVVAGLVVVMHQGV